MKYKYSLFLYYNDVRLLKHQTDFQCWEQFYKSCSEPFIRNSMYEKGETLQTITQACTVCLLHYLQYVKKGYTLSWEDAKLVLCSYFTLFKFNKITDDNIILIKNKWIYKKE